MRGRSKIDMSLDDVLALHRSMGVAISEIDLRWGADPAQLEGGLLGILGHRMGLRDQKNPRNDEEKHQCNVALWDGINARGIPWKSWQE